MHESVKVLVAQFCVTLCDPVDCSPPGSSVYGTLQARILEWAPMLFSRHLPNTGLEPGSPALQADSLLFTWLLSFRRRVLPPDMLIKLR